MGREGRHHVGARRSGVWKGGLKGVGAILPKNFSIYRAALLTRRNICHPFFMRIPMGYGFPK
eukprot:3169097-Rhodomonas_salina.1